jgi:hypothetical protein
MHQIYKIYFEGQIQLIIHFLADYYDLSIEEAKETYEDNYTDPYPNLDFVSIGDETFAFSDIVTIYRENMPTQVYKDWQDYLYDWHYKLAVAEIKIAEIKIKQPPLNLFHFWLVNKKKYATNKIKKN